MVIVTAVVVGSIIGVCAAVLSYRRSAAQPTGAKGTDERRLLGAILANPALFRYATVLEAKDFSWPPHADFWEIITGAAVPDDEPAHVAEAMKFGVPSRTVALTAEELQSLVVSEGTSQDLVDDALRRASGVDRESLLEVGASVLRASESRDLTGWDVPEPGESFENSLVRVPRGISPRRMVVSALFSAAAMWLIALSGATQWALVAAAVLLFGSVLAALVDLDTLYVDTFASWVMAASIGFAVIAAYSTSDGSARLLTAALLVVGVVGSFELIAWLWSKIRGQMGLGGGDSIVLIPTLAVPVLSTGRVEAALWGLIAGLAVAIVAQLSLILAKRASRDTPFALVPYLLAGWPLGWVLATMVLGQ